MKNVGNTIILSACLIFSSFSIVNAGAGEHSIQFGEKPVFDSPGTIMLGEKPVFDSSPTIQLGGKPVFDSSPTIQLGEAKFNWQDIIPKKPLGNKEVIYKMVLNNQHHPLKISFENAGTGESIQCKNTEDTFFLSVVWEPNTELIKTVAHGNIPQRFPDCLELKKDDWCTYLQTLAANPPATAKTKNFCIPKKYRHHSGWPINSDVQ